jgi:hypothetical protein
LPFGSFTSAWSGICVPTANVVVGGVIDTDPTFSVVATSVATLTQAATKTVAAQIPRRRPHAGTADRRCLRRTLISPAAGTKCANNARFNREACRGWPLRLCKSLARDRRFYDAERRRGVTG